MSPSEKHEHDVANFINESIKGLVAERPKVSTSYPDVRVQYGTFKGDKSVWVEVKMNHTDNLMNPRFSYINNEWICPPSYKSEATDILCDIWNNNAECKKWILGLKEFLVKNKWKGNINKLTLYSSKTERVTDVNTVSVEWMKKYLKTLDNKNICKEQNVDVGNLVSLHYLKGKAASAYYLSAGDDFYQFKLPTVKSNPLKIPDVPVFKGTNSVVLRVGDRSDNFEIQAEVKLKNIATSIYSVNPGNKKINPFRKIGI